MDKEAEYYENFDMRGAKRGVHPVIKSLQEKNAAGTTPPHIFAADVVALLHQHANNSQDVQRINGVLRALLAD